MDTGSLIGRQQRFPKEHRFKGKHSMCVPWLCFPARGITLKRIQALSAHWTEKAPLPGLRTLPCVAEKAASVWDEHLGPDSDFFLQRQGLWFFECKSIKISKLQSKLHLPVKPLLFSCAQPWLIPMPACQSSLVCVATCETLSFTVPRLNVCGTTDSANCHLWCVPNEHVTSFGFSKTTT